jgi:5-methyltetrahydropteroyltriglutamate--homocysteine methyltransferase
MTVPEYRRYAALRVETLNHALRGIPPEQVRLHVCWGSHHGPHRDDIPLRDIVDLVLSVPAGCYSIEAANSRHEHEWVVWEDVKLPGGATLMPGVVGHATDIIEHPELVAQRLTRYAQLVGAENVIAGTDCGLAGRVGHPEIVWAKLEDLAAGARLASRALAGRSLSQPRQQAAPRPAAANGLGAQGRLLKRRQADDAVAGGAAVAKCRYRRRDSDPLR